MLFNSISRLELRIYLRIVSVSLAIALGITALQYRYDYGQRIEYLKSEMARLEAAEAETVADYIWNPNPTHLKNLLKALLETSELTFLQVIDEEGEVISEVGSQKADDRIHGSYPLIFKTDGRDFNLGTFVLQIATDRIHLEMRDVLILTLAGNFGKVLIVFFTMMFIIRRFVTNRIAQLSRYFEDFDPDALPKNTGLSLFCPDTERPDELDALVMGINRMHQTILAKIEIIERKSDALREKVDSTEWELQKAHDQKVNLLRALSHDIANPLTVILGNVLICESALKKGKPVNEKKIATIKWAGNTIKQMIDDVRMADAIASGKLELKLEPICLSDSIENAKKMFSDRLKNKGLALKYDAERIANTYVEAHGSSLSNQVVNNLISNAIKFSHEGASITVSVETTAYNRTILKIEDQGIGMPDNIVKGLFAGDTAVSRDGTNGEKGTGFGMLLIKSCMERFGGTISVSSKSIDDYPDDHGTTFSLTFITAEVVPDRNAA